MKQLLFVNLTEAMQDLLQSIMASVPKVLYAILIFVLGYIIVKLIARAIRKLLEKLNIDKLGEKLNEIDIVQKANIKIKLSALFSKVIYYFLMLFVLVAATDVLGMPAVSDLVVGIFNFIPNLIVALIVLILGTLLAELIRSFIYTACKSLGIPSSKLIAMFIFYFIFVNVIISALTQAKINTEFLSQNLSVVIAGAVLAFAIGYGLASKKIMANFLASFYSKDKILKGDVITIQDEKGTVSEIDKSTVTIVSKNRHIIYPLSMVMDDKIIIHKKT